MAYKDMDEIKIAADMPLLKRFSSFKMLHLSTKIGHTFHHQGSVNDNLKTPMAQVATYCPTGYKLLPSPTLDMFLDMRPKNQLMRWSNCNA